MFSACILMAGSGERIGLGYNKALHKINALPLFMYSVDAFLSHPELGEIILVVSESDFDSYDFTDVLSLDIPVEVIVGGSTRLESSYIGVDNARHDIVLVHDAARPLISKHDIDEIYKLSKNYDCVVSGSRVYDSAKLISDDEFIGNINRDELFLSSTPQAVHKEMFLDLVDKHYGTSFTDEASLYEKEGSCNIKYYYLTSDNRKLTTKNDLEYIENKLGKLPHQYRIGHSKDTHRFVEGRKFILGGVNIDYHLGLLGHSDADALMHAITEAILGSVGLADIGTHFPDNDPKYKDMDSKVFLLEAKKLLENKGYEIVNIDAIIYLEKPKLGKYKTLISQNISSILNISSEDVNIKATTKEGLGVIGEGLALEAEAVVLVRKK